MTILEGPRECHGISSDDDNETEGVRTSFQPIKPLDSLSSSVPRSSPNLGWANIQSEAWGPNSLPYISTFKRKLTHAEAYDIAESSCQKAKRVPQVCRRNAIFVVDAKDLASPDDVRSDMNGVFRSCLEIKNFTVEVARVNGEAKVSIISRKKIPLSNGQMYMRVHRTENDAGLVRNIVYFQDAQGTVFKDSVILQYFVNKQKCGNVEEIAFDVPCHGNSSNPSGNSFYPLKKSTLAKI